MGSKKSGKENTGRGILIAIDGPSGSGKSTVSREVAMTLNLKFLETGAMYRALTWRCLENRVNLDDVESILECADQMDFQSVGSVDAPRFCVDGQDVTEALRSAAVAGTVSKVAGHIPVRKWMAKAQRQAMHDARKSGEGMIAEGRDITTVVCPDADVRVVLVADPEARLRRRVLETYGEITPELLESTRALVSGRDETDSRVSSFLQAAPGVTTIDSSDLTVAEVVNQVLELAAIPREAGDEAGD